MLESVCRAAILLAALGSGTWSVVQGQPNVVLIIGDDQAWTDYGFMGHPSIKTPNLDRLASESLVYSFGYVPTSLCRPSLATMITGLYPHQHGITGNDPARPKGVKRSSLQYQEENERLTSRMVSSATLPQLLSHAGYLSFQSGKWWEGHYSKGGFTRGMSHGDPARGGRHGDEGLEIGRAGLDPLFDFIQEFRDRPFFIWYAPFLPHTPHDPPDRLLSANLQEGIPVELSRYYAMCQWFDETVGDLLAYLEAEQLAQRTLVIFVADNGWIQRTEQTPVPSGWHFNFAPRSKRSANEGGIRTPLVLRWPGKIEPGRVDLPVSTIDLAPTILWAAGLEPTDQMSGVNLLDHSAVVARGEVFGDIYTHDVLDLRDPLASLKYRWCVRQPWTLIVPHTPNIPDAELRLFDVVSDPNEMQNLAADRPDLVVDLYRAIQNWWMVE